jgi:hypothetical protein
MTRAFSLDWKEDLQALTTCYRVHPVTAWSFLSEAAGPQGGQQKAYYAVLNAEAPTLTEESNTQLQCVFVVDQDCDAQTFEGIEGIARNEFGITAPRLFRLPLRSESLAAEFGVLTHDQMGGSGESAPLVLGTLPKLGSLPPGFARPDRPKVIVGIIDYAINLAHARFQHIVNGIHRSRVAHAWLQDGAHRGDPLPFGREIYAAEIETALHEAGGDEEAALRRLDLLGFGGGSDGAATVPRTELARRTSHGTHVLDLAAGRDPTDREGMAVQIIAVALPDAVRRDSTGTLLSVFFLKGLDYILMRCRDIGRDTGSDEAPPIPVLVCASLGFAGGPRGGRHLIERAVELAVQRHTKTTCGQPDNVRVVLPAGNSNLARGHATSGRSTGTATLAVPWRLQPGDHTPNHLEAWISHGGDEPPREVQLTLRPPGTLGPPPQRVFRLGESRRLVVTPEGIAGDAADSIGRVAFESVPDSPMRLSIALAATDPGATGRPAAPPGAWWVEITARAPAGAATELRIDAWILRDDDPIEAAATARQSYFDSTTYQVWESEGALLADDPKEADVGVKRTGTLNVIATDRKRTAVGGFVQPPVGATGQVPTPARYSGTPLPVGRLFLKEEECVSWAAPCESSEVLPGVLAAGSRSGSLVALNGTSVAVPQVVRGMVEKCLRNENPEDLDLLPTAPADHPSRRRLGDRPIRSTLAHNRAEARANPWSCDPRL